MTKKLDILDSRLLRAAGKVHGTRPQVSVRHVALKITPLNIDRVPKAPVDTVLIFGMGPVHLSIVQKYLHHDNVAIGQSRMKHNAIAVLELAAHGYINKKGVIIPSGTATANPELMEIVKKLKHNPKTNVDALMAKLELENEKSAPPKKVPTEDVSPKEMKPVLSPTMQKEIEKLYTTSEAEIMEWVFLNAHSKVMKPDGSGRVTGKSLHIEIFRDNLATETIDNFINAINELDKRSRKKNKIMFNGSLAAVTSRYHIARTMETARYLGLENQVVPLVSQEVLKHFGYDTHLFKSSNQFDIATRWNEQKWTRAIHQIPEFILPVIYQIQDDERLINILHNLKTIYGEKVFDNLHLAKITLENANRLRLQLKSLARKNPKIEEWMLTDTKEINEAIDQYVHFTEEWLNMNVPSLQE